MAKKYLPQPEELMLDDAKLYVRREQDSSAELKDRAQVIISHYKNNHQLAKYHVKYILQFANQLKQEEKTRFAGLDSEARELEIIAGQFLPLDMHQAEFEGNNVYWTTDRGKKIPVLNKWEK